MILALRALGLGDLLTAVPAIRALARTLASPDQPLALAVPRPLHGLAQWAGLGDTLIDVDSAVHQPPRRLAVEGPVQLAVNLHGEGPQSTQTLRRLEPGGLWSYGIDGAPPWNPEEHEVARWCRLVAHHGCPADPADLFLQQASGPRSGVVIHPGTARPERRWPADRFADVARVLARGGHRVRITAGPGEEGLAQSVAHDAGAHAVTPATGLELVELAQLVARSALVVCGDTGIAHLATAMRTPSVLIFGPQPPSRWGPPPLPRHTVLWHALAGAGDAGQPHPALLRVHVADVLDAAVAQLAQSDRIRQPAGV